MYHELDDKDMRGTLRDWRKALRTPAPYRVGNTVRLQPQFIYFVLLIGGLVLLLCYYNWWTSNQVHTANWTSELRPYNRTYPLTPVLVSGDLLTYRIGIISDLDEKSKSDKPYTFISYLKKGHLSYDQQKQYVTVSWDEQRPTVLSSTYAHKGRGMELSELIVYDGRLLTFDDRSGLVFEILNNKVIPWLVVADGNGHEEKGFKTEWATINNELLYLGSIGKEWTTASGKFENYNPMWVKAIDKTGQVQHLSWVNYYKAIRSSIGIEFPAYMIHESGAWSELKQRWYFLPRRCSYEVYNETKDEVKGCNYLISADAEFKDLKAVEVLKLNPKLGFSSFKFIPGTNDEAIVALRTLEFEGKTATYITAFNTDGKVLLKDTLIEGLKYEGVEFI